MTFIMPQAAAAVTLPYRWPRSLAVRVGLGTAATLAAERDDGLVVGELERATLSHPDPRDPSRR